MTQTTEPRAKRTGIDIIVIAYNNLDLTTKCLASIEMFAPREHHTILVDNGSTDATPALGRALEAQGHTYVRLDPNGGPYVAANAGLDRCETDLVALLCNDVALYPNSLQYLMAAVDDTRPIIGAVEFCEGGYYDVGRAVHAIETVYGLRRTPALSPGVFFSCFVAQRRLFEADTAGAVGRFDPAYRLTYGDTDWEQRLADLGLPYYRATHAPVFHGQSVTRKRMGIDASVAVDVDDYKTFAKKWAERPDVLAKHPPENVEGKKNFLAGEWKDGVQ